MFGMGKFRELDLNNGDTTWYLNWRTLFVPDGPRVDAGVARQLLEVWSFAGYGTMEFGSKFDAVHGWKGGKEMREMNLSNRFSIASHDDPRSQVYGAASRV